MHGPIDDQTVDFFQELFGTIFSETFRSRIEQRLKRNQVIRQVEEAADAASQSLTRFFRNEQLSEEQVAGILESLSPLAHLLSLDRIANASVTPESLVAEMVRELPCLAGDEPPAVGAIYREAMHSVLQVLLLVGPVMSEWQKLSFSTTFELPRRVVARLNQISEQLGALGRSGREARDENYELTYRDFLLQRFHRIEAGTVRMTTNLAVDLSELFVMPRVLRRHETSDDSPVGAIDASSLMDLSAARSRFAGSAEPVRSGEHPSPGLRALDQLRAYPRNIMVGAPGSGKSTFMEWLQLAVASGSEEFVLAGEQAIPLLLRVRQLDPANLPRGAALVEKATASNERATLMPHGWIDRMMVAGRVLFLLDGLDETEPDLRDDRLIPWLLELNRDFPNCQYLVSSRPVGYPPGLLRSLEFAECDLLDFNSSEMAQYTRHWCTAVRLAQNEPDQEARVEGVKDGDNILAGFKGHPYIRDLARNPLMLSAICLVRYFEGGELPKDRAVLYKRCVEGLLHHWDRRRGIHSEFSMEEKLRACREVALAMQFDDQAEYEENKVRATFGSVLGDEERGRAIFEQIRYRAGLLLERRAGVFAFAHLTFQEYLAAQAIHEGNLLGIGPETLAREHRDGRWKEVIALYCGLAPTPAARALLERLIGQDDSREIAAVLAEAYFTSGPEIHRDRNLRMRIIQRLARAPWTHSALERYPVEEVAPIANAAIGTIQTQLDVSAAFAWLRGRPRYLDRISLRDRIIHRTTDGTFQLLELIHLAFMSLEGEDLALLADDMALLASRGPSFENGDAYSSQASIAVIGLLDRRVARDASAIYRILPRVLDQFLHGCPFFHETFRAIVFLDMFISSEGLPVDVAIGRELAARVVRLIALAEDHFKANPIPEGMIDSLELDRIRGWLKTLDPDLPARPDQGETGGPATHPRRRSPQR